MVKYFPYKLLFITLLLSSFVGCSTEENDFPPEPSYKYFSEVTASEELNRHSLIEKLAGISGGPIAGLLPDSLIRVDAIRYYTVAPDGSEVIASGIVSYPSSGHFKGVVIAQHHTIGADREAPSSEMAMIETTLSLFGYVVICPDLLGFGSTVALPQNYLHAESVGQMTSDMLFAIREYMEREVKAIGDEVYVTGYSQGAYSAMAFTKYAKEKYASQIPVRKVFAGGGPYDPVNIFDLFIESDVLSNPATVLLTVLAMDYSEQLNLDYTKIFLEPVLSNYEEWCISKKYTLGQINRKMESNKLEDFMHPDIFLPQRNSEFDKLYKALHDNQLLHWTPSCPVLLVHGKKDRTVPYVNSEKLYESFKSAGVDVQFISTDLDHNESAIPFYVNILTQLGLSSPE